MIKLTKVQAFVYRAPIQTPVQTSFGLMRDRPAVFVRVEDAEGVAGWGEVWCNFPSCGAEHRARLIDTLIAPLVLQRSFSLPAKAFEWLTAQTSVLAIQTGEYGPLAQCIAGMDLALWDLCARKAQLPLWRYLGGERNTVKIYASGLNPTDPEKLATERLAEGYQAFKLKIGFGQERDLNNLRAMREVIGERALMVDANQGWDLATASVMLGKLSEFNIAWLEEPLRADCQWSEWKELAKHGDTPLAAGENITQLQGFAAAISSGILKVIQPDIAKWGGLSLGLPIAKNILKAGLRFCPHYLGAGIGLLASAHLLAATNADDILEVDANTNPLRSLTCLPLANIEQGMMTLSEEPGLGVVPDLVALKEFLVSH
ncbi:MAG: mandelate racemase [Alcaligenaceae bacterium]|nr:MAG: mandelate racemase [Alcaligenaceae bacterium]